LGVSASLAVATYELTRHSLVGERERTAVRATYYDAAVVRQGVVAGADDIVGVLRSLDTGQARRPLIFRNGRWYARTADSGFSSAVPASLRRLVESGRPGVQRTSLNGVPTLVVGVPLQGVNADYYELNMQTELQRTLRQLALTLGLVALVTTVAAVVLGRWATRRLLRPLASVATAAKTIAQGDLAARLDPPPDPDLAPLTASFNEMVEELAGRIERDRRFAADVSHELRSPLQTLTSAAGVLANRRQDLDQRTASALDLVVDEVDRFSDLVTDLLELARADQEAVLAPVAVRDVVVRVAEAAGVPRAAVHADPGLRWNLDGRRFERILANLVDNGQRHGGGVTAICCTATAGELRLVVEDNGPGVPPDERSLVFNRFGRGRRASARGGSGSSGVDGTGLGLALVAQHVAAHGGTVDVSEATDGGARFEVALPGGAA
jgi:signal transduction histidine kinase